MNIILLSVMICVIAICCTQNREVEQFCSACTDSVNKFNNHYAWDKHKHYRKWDDITRHHKILHKQY